MAQEVLVKVRRFINGSGKRKSSCENLIESPKLYIVTLDTSDTQHNNTAIKLSVYYAECHYPERLYAECHYAECHYAEYVVPP